jgi:hypothetical protein
MRIKTNLIHENKGGYTTVAFPEPVLKWTKKEKTIDVSFCIIKNIFRKKDGFLSQRCFKPRLIKFQQKRILKHTKKLAMNYLKEHKIKLLDEKLLVGTLSMLKGKGNHCIFQLEEIT